MTTSKQLGHDDSSGFEFAKEMLSGDVTAAINFDRIQKRKSDGKYIIFEYLLCEEKQQHVTPYSSHPSKYWHLNSRKFISLCEIANDLNAILYLVNYAKKNTKHEDEILVMKVTDYTEDGITTDNCQHTRKSFSDFFKRLNKESL